MAFSSSKNDFFDYFPFFYDEVTLTSDFFECHVLKLVNLEAREITLLAQSLNETFW